MCVCVYVCMRVCVYTCFQLTINRGLNTILAGVRRGGGQVEEKGLRVPLAASLHYNSVVPASRSKHGTTKQQGVGFWRGAWMRDAAPSGKSRERRRSFSTSTRPSAHKLSPSLLQSSSSSSSSLSPLSSPPPPPSPLLPLPSPSPLPLPEWQHGFRQGGGRSFSLISCRTSLTRYAKQKHSRTAHVQNS